MLFRFADSCDMAYFWFGVLTSFFFGAAMPGFALFFGQLIDQIGISTQKAEFSKLKDTSMYMIIAAVFVWFFSTFFIASLAVFGERVSI